MVKTYGCALLAGGGGARMNLVNKAILEYNGETFSERIQRELNSFGKPCYISCANYEQTAPDGWTAVFDCVTDGEGYIGPIGGIYSCLLRAREDGLDGLFFVPCDAPFFDRCVIEKMLEHIDADMVVWKTGDGRIHRTFGWYSVECLPLIEENIANKEYSLKVLSNRIKTTVLEAEEYGLEDDFFANINTPDDYEKLTQKRHILVCGERNAGKTTLVNSLVKSIERLIKGFRTVVAERDEEGFGRVYMCPADGELCIAESARIGDVKHKVLSVNYEVFDTLGVKLLQAEPGDVIIMDEIGYMEIGTEQFCSEVIKAFDGDVPVLATIKSLDKDYKYLNLIRNHPKAELLMLTRDNYDEVYERALEIVQGWNEEVRP